jgi:hypothetical protein
MSTPQQPDTAAQAVALTADLKSKKGLTVDEVLKLQELQTLLDNMLPPKKKRMKIHSVYR